MFRTTLRSLWSHKRRLISTCVAVVLGVAFMTGTLVLSSTVNRVFDDLFGSLSDGTDAVVRGDELFNSQFTGRQRALLDESVVDAVADVEGVAAAEGSIQTLQLTLLDSDGDPMGGFGPPTIIGSWNVDDEMAAYQIDQGRAPEAAGEVVIDRAGVEDGGFAIGDQVELVSPTGTVSLELVGTSRFGEADSAGGSTFVATTLAQAQELAGEVGKVDSIYVRADAGVSPEDLVQRLEAAEVADDLDIVTGEEAGDEAASDVKSGFSFFSTMLLVFAAIALFVGWFIISNTFNILVAQRTRELALLRAIGATRRQVLGSVFLEAAIIGIVSAILGFAGGVLLAQAAFAGLDAIGFGLPQADLVVTPVIAAYAMGTGLLITAIAAAAPAVRATRVPPIAALRDVAIDRSGQSRARGIAGIVILLLGLVLIRPAFAADPTSSDIPGVGFGVMLLIIAVLVTGPVMAKPLARIVGSPLPYIKGVTGTLARENAMRSPRRTASTASALIIGVSLVAFITIFASSAQRSVNDAVGSGFEGDYIILPINQFTFTGVSPELGAELEQLDGIATVTGIAIVPGQLTLPNGSEPTSVVGGVDPATFEDVFRVKMSEGELADLTDAGIIVDRSIAIDEDIAIGDEVSIVAPGGRAKDFTVEALSDDPALLGQWTVTRTSANELTAQPTDVQLGILATEGASLTQVRADIEDVLEGYPTMKVQDREEFTSGIVQSISTLLNVIYALLAVSIIIALIGIANTLSLSIHERTRELGLLRAMGMTRAQLRSSVRWEATIVALMGTVIGIALGIVLSYTMVKVLASQGITSFDIPVAGMVTVVLFGAGLGVLASVRPAHKASKLNVLEAIATE